MPTVPFRTTCTGGAWCWLRLHCQVRWQRYWCTIWWTGRGQWSHRARLNRNAFVLLIPCIALSVVFIFDLRNLLPNERGAHRGDGALTSWRPLPTLCRVLRAGAASTSRWHLLDAGDTTVLNAEGWGTDAADEVTDRRQAQWLSTGRRSRRSCVGARATRSATTWRAAGTTRLWRGDAAVTPSTQAWQWLTHSVDKHLVNNALLKLMSQNRYSLYVCGPTYLSVLNVLSWHFECDLEDPLGWFVDLDFF